MGGVGSDLRQTAAPALADSDSVVRASGHLHLDKEIRKKILPMSAANIDRLLREPKASVKPGKRRLAVPELKRRVAVRTFSDWNNPEPGSMGRKICVNLLANWPSAKPTPQLPSCATSSPAAFTQAPHAKIPAPRHSPGALRAPSAAFRTTPHQRRGAGLIGDVARQKPKSPPRTTSSVSPRRWSAAEHEHPS